MSTDTRKAKIIELTDFSSQVQLTIPEASAISSSRQSAHSYQSDDTASLGAPLERTTTTVTVTSKSQTAGVIACITLITAIGTLLNGVTTVALPTMAAELSIPSTLELWPSSIQALTCGCTLLLSGSIADALGPRFMYIFGSALQSCFTLGCGLSRTGTQLIVFRGLSGIAISFCLPSAVSIVTSSFQGKRRDYAFAFMGGGQPVGFSIGLALSGVLTDRIGWQWAFYICAIVNTIVLGYAFWALPTEIDQVPIVEGGEAPKWKDKFQRMLHEIDWIGALIASTSLAMLSYVLAIITGTESSIKQPANITLLIVALALIPVFTWWMSRQEKRDLPALIPNSLWRNLVFTYISISVFLVWGAFNATETILTFFFQRVQLLSATKSSLYFLPTPISGALSNIAVGMLVQRVPANRLVLIGTIISLAAPFVMTFATPSSNYWSSGFLANVFNPAGADSLFTVSNLVITSVFPRKTQALAGGVFNTISQIGKSVGLAVAAVIAADITSKSSYADKSSPDALNEGYRAAFWLSFACILFVAIIVGWGLRNIGKVGHKQE